MKVLVVGASGQLGSTFADTPGHDVIPLTRADVDVTDHDALLAAVARIQPDVLVNCTGFTNVDGAEDDATTALAVNAIAVRSMAAAAARAGATFVHYSTDFVFDGVSDRPYGEADRPRPLSTYGSSKLLGEWFALETPAVYVLRVESLFGGHPAKSSIDKILVGIENGQPVRVFADRTVTPSYVVDVAAATEELLRRQPAFGLYHCVNTGVANWHDVAKEAARLLSKDAEIVPVSSDSAKLRAKRPRYCALSNRKLAEAGIAMPTWEDALSRYVALSRD